MVRAIVSLGFSHSRPKPSNDDPRRLGYRQLSGGELDTARTRRDTKIWLLSFVILVPFVDKNLFARRSRFPITF